MVITSNPATCAFNLCFIGYIVFETMNNHGTYFMTLGKLIVFFSSTWCECWAYRNQWQIWTIQQSQSAEPLMINWEMYLLTNLSVCLIKCLSQQLKNKDNALFQGHLWNCRMWLEYIFSGFSPVQGSGFIWSESYHTLSTCCSRDIVCIHLTMIVSLASMRCTGEGEVSSGQAIVEQGKYLIWVRQKSKINPLEMWSLSDI